MEKNKCTMYNNTKDMFRKVKIVQYTMRDRSTTVVLTVVKNNKHFSNPLQKQGLIKRRTTDKQQY